MKQKKKKKKERNQRKRKKRKKGIRKKEKKKKNERVIKDQIIRDIRTHFEQEEDYYKPKRVNSFWNNNYIEFESNDDKNSILSLDKYFNTIKPYLRDIIINLQSSDTWKIQLTSAFNFTSSNVTEEERVIYSTSDSIKFRTYNNINEVVNELFESLRSKYQDNLETSMRRSNFIFDSVKLNQI